MVLFQPTQRENYIRQLQPTHRPIDRLHIRLLGHCASGKSSLISSLKSGIFSFGFFRRSRSQNYSTKVYYNITYIINFLLVKIMF